MVVGHSGIESHEIKILWTLHFQYSFSIQDVHGVQSQKTNIAPGRRPSQKETSLLTPVFQVLYWFQGGYQSADVMMSDPSKVEQAPEVALRPAA